MFKVTFKQRTITLCCIVALYFWGVLPLNAQVSIGTTNPPDPSAVLDVVAINKGALFPRVALRGPTDATTIPNPATGLLVYNTGDSASFAIKAYMYWDGVEWRALYSMTTTAAEATLECGMAYLDPEVVIQGDGLHPIPNGTVLKLPYTVGNGGVYIGDTLYSYPDSNIVAIIYPGQLESGSGFLTFHVSGTPNGSQTTPKGIKFPLHSFYDANPGFTVACDTIHVGVEIKADIKTVALIDNLKISTEDNGVVYQAQLTTPDGKFSVRCCIPSHDWESNTDYFGTDGVGGMNLQIRCNLTDTVIISGEFQWFFEGATGGNGYNALRLHPGKWSGDDQLNNRLSVDQNAIPYANYFDGSVTATDVGISTSQFNRGRFIHWGNAGVYASGGPERREYHWTINDGATTRTAYFMTFSSSAAYTGVSGTIAKGRPNTVNCPNGVCTGTKIFLKIDQVIATAP
jgi:hypothetical protein